MQSLLKLLAQFGEATTSKELNSMDPSVWQLRISALPPSAQVTLRQALLHVEALAELRRCAFTQFDPEVVQVFCAELEARHPAQQAASRRAVRS